MLKCAGVIFTQLNCIVSQGVGFLQLMNRYLVGWAETRVGEPRAGCAGRILLWISWGATTGISMATFCKRGVIVRVEVHYIFVVCFMIYFLISIPVISLFFTLLKQGTFFSSLSLLISFFEMFIYINQYNVTIVLKRSRGSTNKVSASFRQFIPQHLFI